MASGGKNWQPSAYNPQLGLIYIPSIEGCNSILTIEQKDRDDEGGPVKARERFTGGPFKAPDPRLYGALAVDPTTGEIKANFRLGDANFAGALATAGNLVFLGHVDGTFSAYDARMSAPASMPPLSAMQGTASSMSPCSQVRVSRRTSFRRPPNSRTRRRRLCYMSSVCSRVPCRLIAAGGSPLASPAPNNSRDW
jgi:hypothetical protein